jgi:hypothetical protein
MRTYYLFQAGSDPELQAVADDPTGDKLPAEDGPWTLVRQLSSDEDWPHTTTREVVLRPPRFGPGGGRVRP